MPPQRPSRPSGNPATRRVGPPARNDAAPAKPASARRPPRARDEEEADEADDEDLDDQQAPPRRSSRRGSAKQQAGATAGYSMAAGWPTIIISAIIALFTGGFGILYMTLPELPPPQRPGYKVEVATCAKTAGADGVGILEYVESSDLKGRTRNSWEVTYPGFEPGEIQRGRMYWCEHDGNYDDLVIVGEGAAKTAGVPQILFVVFIFVASLGTAIVALMVRAGKNVGPFAKIFLQSDAEMKKRDLGVVGALMQDDIRKPAARTRSKVGSRRAPAAKGDDHIDVIDDDEPAADDGDFDVVDDAHDPTEEIAPRTKAAAKPATRVARPAGAAPAKPGTARVPAAGQAKPGGTAAKPAAAKTGVRPAQKPGTQRRPPPAQ